MGTLRECLKKDGQSGFGDINQPKEEDKHGQKNLARRNEQCNAFQEPPEQRLE
jgi:hypothetical protein